MLRQGRAAVLIGAAVAALVLGASRDAFASPGCTAINAGAWLFGAAPNTTASRTGVFVAGDLVTFTISSSVGAGHSFSASGALAILNGGVDTLVLTAGGVTTAGSGTLTLVGSSGTGATPITVTAAFCVPAGTHGSAGCMAINSGSWLFGAAPNTTVSRTGAFWAGDRVFFTISSSVGAGHSFSASGALAILNGGVDTLVLSVGGVTTAGSGTLTLVGSSATGASPIVVTAAACVPGFGMNVSGGPTSLAATGNVGGPFTPSSFTYQLSVEGEGHMSYSIAGVPDWLTASATSGTVNDGASVPLTFTVNASANSLPAGTYGPATIAITNTTNGNGSGSITATLMIGGSGPMAVVSAVLPASRSVQVGSAATAFATVINTSTTNIGTSCGLSLGSAIPAMFQFQTTDPQTNALGGTANTPVSIGPSSAQSFVFSLTPSAVFAPTDVAITAKCTNSSAATTVVGLNTLLLSASAAPVPDIVALAASVDPGYVDLPGANGTGAFSVASVNVGSSASITVSADTGPASLPVAITLCQTNAQARCTNPATPAASATVTISANDTPTFSIFVKGSGTVANDPANNRIFVRFKDAGGVTRGSTSVAVRTQ